MLTVFRYTLNETTAHRDCNKVVQVIAKDSRTINDDSMVLIRIS